MQLRNSISGRCLTIIVVMLMSFFLLAAAGKKNPQPAQFDFKKTSAFTHEFDARPDYPISVILARDYVYSVLALGETMDPILKKRTIDFIKGLQRPDGGFAADLPATESSAQNTDFALEVLLYLGAVNAIDAGKVRSYIASLKEPDGGFSFNAKIKGSSLQTTFCAVHALSYINGLDLVDKAKTAAYIKGFENKESGGFNYVRGTGAANVTNTFMAVFTLKTLGMLDGATRNSSIRFLSTTPYMGRKMKYDVNQTLQEQAYAIITLKMLGAEKKINKGGAVEFTKSFYIPVNGGFGPIHGYGSAPDPTYFGIQGLAELGVLKKPI